MKREVEIDAVATLEGERGRSALGDVRNRSIPGAKMIGLIVLAVVLALLGVLAYRFMMRSPKEEQRGASTMDVGIRNQMPELRHIETPPPPSAPSPIVPELRPEPKPVRPSATTARAAGEVVKSPAQLLRERRLLSGLTEGSMRQTAAVQTPDESGSLDDATLLAYNPQSEQRDTKPPSSMADRLAPLRLSASVAGHVGSMDLLLLQSAMIDCVLNTRIDSTTQPGMMSCDATRDVYSSNGRTVLLDRGTRFTGRYEQGITRGQPRIFVVWERAVTPQGVVINLDSPGTDPLGGAGLPGKVNYRFWRRFGSAILISVFEDAGDYAVARANRGSGTYIDNTTRSAADNASIVLQHSINIPPTLTKRHGDRVSIFVAHDLDFSRIYELRHRH